MGLIRGIFSSSLLLIFLVLVPWATHEAVSGEDIELSMNVGILMILGTLIAAFSLAKHIAEKPYREVASILQMITWGAYFVYSLIDFYIITALEDISIRLSIDFTTFIMLVLIGLSLSIFTAALEISEKEEAKSL